MSVRPTPKILSMKGKYAFCFSSFLVIGLCNSLANFYFEIFSSLTPLPNNLLLKIF